jgi:parvulin-like peptidyl-prolyl isomerase
MQFPTQGRRRTAVGFFSWLFVCGVLSAQTVGTTTGGAQVTRTEVLGALSQALRESPKPFNDADQQKALVDALIDFKTVPERAQKHFNFTETERAFIARQSGEATAKAVAQLVDWRYRQKHSANATHIETRARELYAAQAKEITTAPTFELSHLVIRVDTRSIEEAVTRARQAYDRIAAGASFEAVALEYSDDPTVKQNKGLLPPLTNELVDQAFARNALLPGNVGKLLPPFLARSGIHVVKVHKYDPPKQLDYNAVKERMIAAAIDEITAVDRTKDWNAIRVPATERRYALESLSDLIAPPPSAAETERLRTEALRIKRDLQKSAPTKQ